MKYSEAKKQIKVLSSKYSLEIEDANGYFNVNYKGAEIAFVNRNKRYECGVCNVSFFKQMPFSNKLYMILSELAMTPLEERKDETKYKVNVLNEYLNIDENNKPLLADDLNTDSYQTIFTLAEISKIKERKDIPLDWDKVNIKPIYVS